MIEIKDLSPIRYNVHEIQKGIYIVLDLADANKDQWTKFKKHIKEEDVIKDYMDHVGPFYDFIRSLE
jgi:hypothetical protein